MIELIDMRFDPSCLYSLTVFTEIVKKIVTSTSSKEYNCALSSRQERAFGPHWVGTMYQLTVNATQKRALPFFGLPYEQPREGRGVDLLLPPAQFSAFNQSSLAEQEGILRSFFSSTNELLVQLISS
jgi:hypothetical protein